MSGGHPYSARINQCSLLHVQWVLSYSRKILYNAILGLYSHGSLQGIHDIDNKIRSSDQDFIVDDFLQINVTHYFSIDKARRVLGYEPKKVTPADWQLILESFRKNPKIKLKNNNKQIISIINSKGMMQKKIHKLLSKKL